MLVVAVVAHKGPDPGFVTMGLFWRAWGSPEGEKGSDERPEGQSAKGRRWHEQRDTLDRDERPVQQMKWPWAVHQVFLDECERGHMLST